MTNRWITCAAFMLGVCATLPSQVRAQGMASSGNFVLSGERLYGLVSSTTTIEADTALSTETEVTTTRITLFTNPSDGTPWAVPRLAFDFLPIDNLTLGAAFGYSSASSETETRNDLMSTSSDTDQSLLLFHARVGYLLMFTESLGLWPKLGIGYFNGESGQDNEASLDGIALSLDGALVVELVRHFGLSFAVFADLGLGGEAELDLPAGTSANGDATVTDFGLMGGVYGWL